MQKKVLIKEIFESIQGEGPYIGYNQLFIRFSKCNLHCSYCDTDFSSNLTEYTAEELAFEVNKYKNIHSVSLTGGEPLLEFEFLKDFLPLVNNKIYLETNGTLYAELNQIINLVDIISMDIKLNSASHNGDLFKLHEKFIQTAIESEKEIFAKVVFDENITDKEIEKTVNLAEKYNLQIILQPMMNGNIISANLRDIINVFDKFAVKNKNVRLIPQVHKFLNVR